MFGKSFTNQENQSNKEVMWMNRTVKSAVAVGVGLTMVFGGGLSYKLYGELQGDLGAATDTINRLEQKIDDKDNQIAEMDKKINDITYNHNALKKQKQELNDEVYKVAKKNEALKKANQALQVKKQKASKENQKVSIASKVNKENNDFKSSALNVKATAYTAFCDTGCTGVTRTGVDVSNTVYHEGRRVIAVDPNVIPLNSIVKVKTATMEFEGIAVDTGGAIKGNKIDILVNNTSVANEFGRQDAVVEVIN
jgi:3D (Asp-Asp-Asp) domain-containing protein